jgi:FKBP-type peptidyl-prolyl cis-trans isomerase
MKKLLYLLITFTVLALPFVSCKDDDKIDEAWKAVNDEAYKNVVQKGYKELPSKNGGPAGIYYQEIKKGDGTEYPLQTSKVEVLYAGTYYDESFFDVGTTYSKVPVEFSTSSIVRGFSYALQNMKVGDHWKICIPYYLGYGASGEYDYYGTVTFKGYTTLFFDIELISITQYP